MKLKIYPYKLGSLSAKVLAKALNVKRIVPGGKYTPRPTTKIINWGNSNPHVHSNNMLNKPEAVRIAANKLLTLQTLQRAGVPVPEFTTDANAAKVWQTAGFRIMARHKLSSHTGEGIQVVHPEEAIPYAPLYTKYMKKEKEYRVHVFQGNIIDITEKRKKYGELNAHPLIRNHKHGWVFCRENIAPSQLIKDTSIKAVSALGLDFGAVDIIERSGKVWVLEINTAPGIEGATLTKYVSAFSRLRGYV